MKGLTLFIKEWNEDWKKQYNVLCRITTSSPYSSFLFANNIWCDGNGDEESCIDDVMKRLSKYNKIFSKFPKPSILPRSERGGSRIALSKMGGYTLKITFNYYNTYNLINVNTNEPIFSKTTSRWSETTHEREMRFDNFEKSKFNDFCEKEVGLKFILK